MFRRWIALFVAVMLLGSGLGSAEARAISAVPEQHAVAVDEAPPASHEGSNGQQPADVPDDAAALAFGDPPPSETPGLLPAPLRAGFHAFMMARPRGFAPAGARSPFLAGPLRPPCSVARAG